MVLILVFSFLNFLVFFFVIVCLFVARPLYYVALATYSLGTQYIDQAGLKPTCLCLG